MQITRRGNQAKVRIGSRRNELQYHLMLAPVMLFLLVFSIVPMFGIVIAFQKYLPAKGIFGSEFVGLKYINQMLSMPNSWRIFRNTLVIACWKIVMNMVVPITFAILLNEIRNAAFKRDPVRGGRDRWRDARPADGARHAAGHAAHASAAGDAQPGQRAERRLRSDI